jgi:hypothetical protein
MRSGAYAKLILRKFAYEIISASIEACSNAAPGDFTRTGAGMKSDKHETVRPRKMFERGRILVCQRIANSSEVDWASNNDQVVNLT